MAANDNSFTLTHKFDVSVDDVFQAWTDPEKLKLWFPPPGFSMIFSESDIKPRGESHYCLKSTLGIEIWRKLFYKDIIAPAKLSYTQVYSNEQGGIEPHPMIKSFPIEVFTTVMLDKKYGKTILNLTWEPVNASMEEITRFSDETFELSQEWGGTFERLEQFLTSK